MAQNTSKSAATAELGVFSDSKRSNSGIGGWSNTNSYIIRFLADVFSNILDNHYPLSRLRL